jgi:5-formyltetrahydrofolate cyclo-ligase
MTNTLITQRNHIRKIIRMQRQALSERQQQSASMSLFAHLIKHSKVKQAQHLSVTLSYDGEIDLTPFIEWCWAENKQVYLPVIHPHKIGEMVFLAYTPSTPMMTNRYGIKEPQLNIPNGKPESRIQMQTTEIYSAKHLDIIFTPLVAFDQQGNRIGMGGGYYDRLLAPWFAEKQGAYPIGLAHDCQCVEALPIQEWDVPLPEIITPNQHFRFDNP